MQLPKRCFACLWVVASLLFFACSAPAQELGVEVVDQKGKPVVVVKGLTAPEVANVQVWLHDADVNVDPPMLGSVERSKDRVIFRPRFAVQQNTKLNIAVQTDPKLKPTHFTATTPARAKAAATIDAVFPSADELPENILKFYVQFSTPMQKGDIYRFVRLRELDGPDIELAFLEIEQELWSRDSKRLTLLLDPGRIKRGLKPREEMGPIFVAGESYELVIDGKWPNADGVAIGKDYVKRFLAIDEDRSQPDPVQWKIKAPDAGAADPLTVTFLKPLDQPMLMRAIEVRNAKSHPVAGKASVSDQEKTWSFQPDKPWKPGKYKLIIEETLEDNAGNSIGKPFDVDVFQQTEPPTGKTVELEFEV